MNTVEPIRDIQKILAIKRILKEQSNPRDYLLFTMGINFALRINDLLSLKVKDVLDKKGEIVEYLHLREQKTKKEKKIKINRAVIEALEYYFKRATITDPDNYLFTSYRSNKKLDRIRVWQMIKDWCKEVGLDSKRIGTHTLRKTWGYQARKKGITIEQISEKLGHRSSIVTKRYIGINQGEINKIEDEVCL
jgi:integrase